MMTVAREGHQMKQVALIVLGVLVALAGAVWTLQGLGYIGGSFMSGATLWAVIGPLVLLAGLAIVYLALRGRRRSGSQRVGWGACLAALQRRHMLGRGWRALGGGLQPSWTRATAAVTDRWNHCRRPAQP